jgi:hypothetical protein
MQPDAATITAPPRVPVMLTRIDPPPIPGHHRAVPTCGNQHAPSAAPPERCVICEDERQFVPPGGQVWTTAEALGRDHATVVREEEPGLYGIGLEPAFGIGQRALLATTPAGNVLWDCIPLIDAAAETRIRELGGIAAIAISHPHFHAACVDVAEAFDAPVHLARADARWILRPSDRIVLFDDEVEPVPGVTVARAGGHFPGASVLHWTGADGAGVLLTGDTVTVVPAAGWVSFMWSFPNLLPLDAGSVRALAARVDRLEFDRLYAGWWGRAVRSDARRVVRRSAERYLARLAGD